MICVTRAKAGGIKLLHCQELIFYSEHSPGEEVLIRARGTTSYIAAHVCKRCDVVYATRAREGGDGTS